MGGVVKTTQHLKTEYSKEIERLRNTQEEMNMELKASTSQLENPRGSFMGRMEQVEDRISELKDKVEELNHSVANWTN